MSGVLYNEYGRNTNMIIRNYQDILNKNTGGYRTDERGIKNILNVRNQIEEKVQAMQNGQMYFPTIKQIKGTVVDVDSYPYTRMSRSNVFDDFSTVWEREAGWHPLINTCNQPVIESAVPSPVRLCYQTPCNQVQPCTPPYNITRKIETTVNKQCLDYLYQ